jgi:hypothetical protein
MSLHLHIDRLVLEGTALTPRDGAALQAALAAELTGLLQSRGLHPELSMGIALPSLPVSTMLVPPVPEASAFGRQLARHLAGPLTAQGQP